MKSLYLTLILALCYSAAFGCLHTYQIKVFPVGMSAGKIIAVDVEIIRTDLSYGNQKYKWNLKDNIDLQFDAMFVFKTYVSVYDDNQKLLSQHFIGEYHDVDTAAIKARANIDLSNMIIEPAFTPADTAWRTAQPLPETLSKPRLSEISHNGYVKALGRGYDEALNYIGMQYPGIEYFTPRSLAICDFEKLCFDASTFQNTLTGKKYLVYKGKKYPLPVLKDTSYYGLRASKDRGWNITDLRISSVRVFEYKGKELLVVHLQTGHELSMGFMEKPEEKDAEGDAAETQPLPEYTLYQFSDIRKAIYEEDVMHHGFGFDVFIVR